MSAFRSIWHELVGLFVDDGALALLLVLWCAAVGLAALLLPGLAPAVAGGTLLLGCAAILLASVRRATRRR